MESLIESKSSMGFRVIGYRVLVQPIEVSDFCGKSRIIHMPTQFKKWATKGIITGIGAIVDTALCGFKIGDRVFFGNALKGVDIELKNIKYKILSPDDIEAIIE